MIKSPRKNRYYIIAALVFSTLFSLPAISEQGPAKVMIVKFHADWCNTCKNLEPTLSALKEEFENKPVDWVVLDLTDTNSFKKAIHLAESLGISNHLKENGNKTGSLRVLNASTKELLFTLTKKMNKTEMAQAISQALE